MSIFLFSVITPSGESDECLIVTSGSSDDCAGLLLEEGFRKIELLDYRPLSKAEMRKHFGN